MKNGCFFLLFRLHVCRDRVGGEGGFLENTIRISLPKGPPLGFGEICGNFWDFRRGDPEVVFLLLLKRGNRPNKRGAPLSPNYPL
eukprot:COSAG06_NODE_11247_length_1539_cov_1.263889_2_plen_85_part_00